MRYDPGFRDEILARGLAVAACATLGTATLLVVAGLAWELIQLRTTVVSEAPRVPSRQVAARQAVVHATATAMANDNATEGETADPGPAAIGPSPGPVGAVAGAANAAGTATGGLAGPPTSLADDPTPDPVATASPEPEVAAEPSPDASTPAVARARLDFGPPGAPRASADVPIVMFHYIGPLPPNPDIFRKDLTVSADVLDGVLQYLDDQQATTVTPGELMAHFAGGPELPKRSAILTFDDGYDNAYDYAFPLLKKHGMVGTFYIITDFVGRPGYLTWDEIAEMDAAGMTIGAHSLTHPDFTTLNPAELRRQLVQPKQVLEDHLGHPVVDLAYPSGKYNAATIIATKAAGYATAVTVTNGLTHPASAPLELTRIRAHGADTAAALDARLTPASWRR